MLSTNIPVGSGDSRKKGCNRDHIEESSCINEKQMLEGSGEWENIPDVIRQTFNIVSVRQNLLNEHIQSLSSQFSALRRKMAQAFVAGNRQDEAEEAQRQQRALMTVLSSDIEQIKNDLTLKANKREVEECLLTKANRSEGYLALQQHQALLAEKSTINDNLKRRVCQLEETLERKIGELEQHTKKIDGMENAALNTVSQRITTLEEEFEELFSICEAKAGVGEVNAALDYKASKRSVSKALRKKVDESSFKDHVSSIVAEQLKHFQAEYGDRLLHNKKEGKEVKEAVEQVGDGEFTKCGSGVSSEESVANEKKENTVAILSTQIDNLRSIISDMRMEVKPVTSTVTQHSIDISTVQSQIQLLQCTIKDITGIVSKLQSESKRMKKQAQWLEENKTSLKQVLMAPQRYHRHSVTQEQQHTRDRRGSQQSIIRSNSKSKDDTTTFSSRRDSSASIYRGSEGVKWNGQGSSGGNRARRQIRGKHSVEQGTNGKGKGTRRMKVEANGDVVGECGSARTYSSDLDSKGKSKRRKEGWKANQKPKAMSRVVRRDDCNDDSSSDDSRKSSRQKRKSSSSSDRSENDTSSLLHL